MFSLGCRMLWIDVLMKNVNVNVYGMELIAVESNV